MSRSPSLRTALMLALPLAACDTQPISEDTDRPRSDGSP